MPTLFILFGFKFMFYSNDHTPHSYPSLMEISDYESKSMDNRH